MTYAQHLRNLRKAKRLIAANKFPAAVGIFTAAGRTLEDACFLCEHLRWELANA